MRGGRDQEGRDGDRRHRDPLPGQQGHAPQEDRHGRQDRPHPGHLRHPRRVLEGHPHRHPPQARRGPGHRPQPALQVQPAARLPERHHDRARGRAPGAVQPQASARGVHPAPQGGHHPAHAVPPAQGRGAPPHRQRPHQGAGPHRRDRRPHPRQLRPQGSQGRPHHHLRLLHRAGGSHPADAPAAPHGPAAPGTREGERGPRAAHRRLQDDPRRPQGVEKIIRNRGPDPRALPRRAPHAHRGQPGRTTARSTSSRPRTSSSRSVTRATSSAPASASTASSVAAARASRARRARRATSSSTSTSPTPTTSSSASRTRARSTRSTSTRSRNWAATPRVAPR